MFQDFVLEMYGNVFFFTVFGPVDFCRCSRCLVYTFFSLCWKLKTDTWRIAAEVGVLICWQIDSIATDATAKAPGRPCRLKRMQPPKSSHFAGVCADGCFGRAGLSHQAGCTQTKINWRFGNAVISCQSLQTKYFSTCDSQIFTSCLRWAIKRTCCLGMFRVCRGSYYLVMWGS